MRFTMKEIITSWLSMMFSERTKMNIFVGLSTEGARGPAVLTSKSDVSNVC